MALRGWPITILVPVLTMHWRRKSPFPQTRRTPSFRTRFSRRAARTPRTFRLGSPRRGGRSTPSPIAPTGRCSFPKPVLSSALSESRTASWWFTSHGFPPDNGEQDAGPNDEERGRPQVPERKSVARTSSSVSFPLGCTIHATTYVHFPFGGLWVRSSRAPTGHSVGDDSSSQALGSGRRFTRGCSAHHGATRVHVYVAAARPARLPHL